MSVWRTETFLWKDLGQKMENKGEFGIDLQTLSTAVQFVNDSSYLSRSSSAFLSLPERELLFGHVIFYSLVKRK